MSFVHSLYIVARPYCVELARVPGSTVWWPPMPRRAQSSTRPACWSSPRARRSTSPMPSASCARIRVGHRRRQRLPVKLLVIEANGIIDIDYTGSQILRRAIAELASAGIWSRSPGCRTSGRRRRQFAPACRERSAGPRVHVGRGGGAQARTVRLAPEISDKGELQFRFLAVSMALGSARQSMRARCVGAN